ncbi:hypothetical protein F5X68DRAFT_232577 [Plectosphaerella plurivora]|uniref:Uncharacterized protein n=1 Tax=Plectosphaerella plurivora TaxID=936078 RepID=A0A9P8VCG7_9PEZI|nr:hypothetical protein F5X68DRAFT_232577 [Plectosphaerella plurivora]
MQPIAILLAVFAARAMALPSSNIIGARQANTLEEAEKLLETSRNESIENIQDGGGRGRKLSDTFTCSARCQQCRNGAIATAVGEIALCGTAALGIAAVTGPLGVFLDVVGFAACETTAIGELNKSEAECTSI